MDIPRNYRALIPLSHILLVTSPNGWETLEPGMEWKRAYFWSSKVRISFLIAITMSGPMTGWEIYTWQYNSSKKRPKWAFIVVVVVVAITINKWEIVFLSPKCDITGKPHLDWCMHDLSKVSEHPQNEWHTWHCETLTHISHVPSKHSAFQLMDCAGAAAWCDSGIAS